LSQKQIITNGWLSGCRHLHSPYYSNRSENAEIALLVIHNISLPRGDFLNGNISKLFLGYIEKDDALVGNHPIEVSAHLLINRLGEVTQFVSFDLKAWHAGLSEFEGRKNCNDFSIGIELEGADDIEYTDVQYRVLNGLIEILKSHYPLRHIVGHSDIAPSRKTDPGPAFDWARVNFTSDEGVS